MNKKIILALLSVVWLWVNFVFGGTNKNVNIKLEEMKSPDEMPVDLPPKQQNPFSGQDKELMKVFNKGKKEEIFNKNIQDPFMDSDPWDD